MPGATLYDDFTRADGRINVGNSLWEFAYIGSTVTQTNGFIFSNTARGDANVDRCSVTTATFGPDINVTVEVVTPAVAELWWRITAPGSTQAGIRVIWQTDGSWAVRQMPAFTLLGSGSSSTMNTGDTLGVEHEGTTIRVLKKNSGGSWTTVGTINGTVASTAGRVGFASDASFRGDNFGAGNFAAGGTTQNGAASLSGESSFTASGVETLAGSAALSGASGITAVGSATLVGSASLSGASTATAAGLLTTFGSATLTGQSSLTGTPFTPSVVAGAANLSGASGVTSAASLTTVGTSALSGQSSMAAQAAYQLNGAASLSGQSGFVADPTQPPLLGVAQLLGQSQLVGVGNYIGSGSAVIVGSSGWHAVSRAVVSSTGHRLAAGRVIRSGGRSITGPGTGTIVRPRKGQMSRP